MVNCRSPLAEKRFVGTPRARLPESVRDGCNRCLASREAGPLMERQPRACFSEHSL
jgi:hypothetical protein